MYVRYYFAVEQRVGHYIIHVGAYAVADPGEKTSGHGPYPFRLWALDSAPPTRTV